MGKVYITGSAARFVIINQNDTEKTLFNDLVNIL